MKDIIISDKNNLEEIKQKIFKEGKNNFQVIADFDRTLTRVFVNHNEYPSVISLLRDGNHLTPDYAPKAHALFNEYHPIEIDPNISDKEKKIKMQEWWTKHIELLIKCGLNKKDLENIVNSGKIKFRKGSLEFLKFLYKNNIPLIIMSANGVGNTIPMYFQQKGLSYDNIHIITNLFEFDESGKAVKISKPIIHSMNKTETALQNYPVYNSIKNRKNVLLLGDGLGDVGMIEGFPYKNLIKVGFLNEDVEKLKEVYKKSFDVIILNDRSMSYVNKLLKEMIK